MPCNLQCRIVGVQMNEISTLKGASGLCHMAWTYISVVYPIHSLSQPPKSWMEDGKIGMLSLSFYIVYPPIWDFFSEVSCLGAIREVSPDWDRLREGAHLSYIVLNGDLSLCPRACPLLSWEALEKSLGLGTGSSAPRHALGGALLVSWDYGRGEGFPGLDQRDVSQPCSSGASSGKSHIVLEFWVRMSDKYCTLHNYAPHPDSRGSADVHHRCRRSEGKSYKSWNLRLWA